MRFKCNTFPSAQNWFKDPLHGRIASGAGLILSMLTFAASAQSGQQPKPANADIPAQVSTRDTGSDTNMQLNPSEPAPKAQVENPADSQRRQMADQSALLLQMATELKKAVDNSDACTLSIHIVRKADSIAKLAHGVKEEMKRTVAQK